MGNMNLVTGYAGKEHVTAADQGALYAALFGSGNYVLDLGEKFAATKLSDNSVRIASGEALLQGRHCRIDNGLYIDLAVESGTAGYLRNDLVCIRYTVDENTGVEDTNLVIVRGTPVAASPTDPAHTAGDILSGGGKLAEFPIYRLRLNGITLEAIEPLFDESVLNFDAFCKSLETYKTEVSNLFAGVNDEFAAVRNEMVSSGYAKMKVGTYKGTGTYGASNPTKIVCDFKPQLVFIYTSSTGSAAFAEGFTYPSMFHIGQSAFDNKWVGNGSGACSITWGSNYVSWYNGSSDLAQNNNGSRCYTYMILG